ncbi:MAG: acetate--CoA ligase family protein, partial [Deltaproteobacteria bacterium]|nr:acetate--CoA ligase family protein [Deltaproteobacteria bacterium]
GLKAYPSVQAIPEELDCAIISVPAPAVPAAVEACAEKHVPLAVIFSSGFAEYSEEGRRAQERIAQVARSSGMRLLGPNTMGALSIDGAFSATFTSISQSGAGASWPRRGNVSVVSQSGAVGTQILLLLRERGLGVAKWIATGNQCDLNVADCIEHLANDEVTRVIAVYLEGSVGGQRLRQAFEAARARRKPVIMLKVGESAIGAAAAASHTASLAGAAEVYRAVLRQHNVFAAQSLQELVDVVAACRAGRFPERAELAVTSGSGGINVIMADACARLGVALPEVPAQTQRKLKELVPYATTRNPVDMAAPGMGNMELEAQVVELLLDEGGYSSVFTYVAHNGMMPKRMEELARHLMQVREKFPDRVIGIVANMMAEWRDRFQEQGFVVYEEPPRAIAAIAALWRIGRGFSDGDAREQPAALPNVVHAPEMGRGGEQAAKRVIASMGITVVDERLVRSAVEAVDAAKAFGKAVVLKIASPAIPHKSDIGGVLIGLRSGEDVAGGYDTLMARVRDAAPTAQIDGVLVSPLIQGGVETIAGVKRDPVFGPVVMFGMGGIFVEIYRDVSLRVAPFGVNTAREMIREIVGYPLLAGARGRAPADLEALAGALSLISAYADRFRDELDSIDINPLIVLPEGKGVVAVDALVVPKGQRL